MATLAFSYLRFSSPQQSTGDSIRRQTESTAAWAQRNGVLLDESLALRDDGVSAFKGKHRAAENADTFALAGFLAAVKSGRVPAGSYLVLESLDRLTREDIIPAVNLFTSLLMAGIKVVQIHPVEHVYTMGADITAVMLALVELSRGNSESKMKSERVGAAWRRKKKNATTEVLTRMTPGWVKVEGGKLVLDTAKAMTVQRIYRMAREGYGLGAICQRLNGENVPLLGRTTFRGTPLKWSVNVVYKVLSNRAVVGEYAPHVGRGPDRKPAGEPIKNYYPPVITEAEFNAVRGIMSAKNTVRRGRRGKHVNLFAGLLKDARTGGSLTAKHGNSRSGVIIPVQSRANTDSPWVSYPLAPFEQAIREKLAEVQVRDVIGKNGVHDRIDSLQGAIAEQETLRAVWTAKMDNPKIADVVGAKLGEISDRLTGLRAEMADAQQEAASPISEAWAEARTAAKTLADDDTDDARVKYRAAVRRAVESIWVLMMPGRGRRVAAAQVWFKNGARRDYLVVCHVAQGTGKAKERRDPRTTVKSLTGLRGKAGAFDLRKPDHAAALAELLADVDLDSLTGV